jgi:hypothetical protein
MNSALKTELSNIDEGRFKEIVSLFDVRDICGECGYFNLSIKDPMQRYRCNVMGSCIAATINHDMRSYLCWKMGWIDEAEHHKNIGIK